MAFAFLLVAITATPSWGGSDGFASIMQSGMILRRLIYPLNPLSPDDNQVLTAAEAVVLEPAHLLRIKGLRLAGGRKSGGFSFEAPVAVFDLRAKSIITENGFRADGCGLHLTGAMLRTELKSKTYQIGGRFEIQPGGLQSPFAARKKTTDEKPSPFLPPTVQPNRLASSEAMTSMKLVQDFAGDIATFLDCWRWVDDRDFAYHRLPATYTLMGHQGGEIDLERMEMTLDGQSSILGPRTVLVSSGGMRLRQETWVDEKLMRMTGEGGIRTWIHPPQSSETWIRSSHFEYVSDRQILQFEGGPLVVGRKGMILEATESWQFVRVFDGGRVVLSPGPWNVVGDIAAFAR